MALKPKIKACLDDNCDKLRVTDTTGVYNNPDNKEGWGSPNISGSDVDTAEIIVVKPDGSSNTHDVTSQVPDSVSGNFEYNPIQGTYPDGKYCIKYHIVASEPETLPTITFSYSGDTSPKGGQQYKVKVDTDDDGTFDTTIGSYTASSGDSLDIVYQALADDINNNSSFSATNDSSNDDLTVTAPSGTGSSYNGHGAEVTKDGATEHEGSFLGGSDAIDVDETYKICQPFTCHIRCCIEKMRSNIPVEYCGCEYDKYLRDVLDAEGLFRGLKSAYGCDDLARANSITDTIKRLCNFDNCDC